MSSVRIRFLDFFGRWGGGGQRWWQQQQQQRQDEEEEDKDNEEEDKDKDDEENKDNHKWFQNLYTGTWSAIFDQNGPFVYHL